MQNRVYQLTNRHGVLVKFISQGGKITSVQLPAKKGMTDIVVGYDQPDEYLTGDEYIGALCGRFVNRIKNGRVHINGKVFQLSQNLPPHHIHGGFEGFHKKFWKVVPVEKQAYELHLFSPDGEEGYPGNLKVTVTYALTDDNEFIIDLKAVTDKPTIINLTSHSYFNLNGPGEDNVLDHLLQIHADRYTPLDKDKITTGLLSPVENTPLDLRLPKRLTGVVLNEFPQIQSQGGLDLNWVLNKQGHELSPAAMLQSKKTGIKLEIFTTQYGLQVYTGQHLNSKGKRGFPLRPFCGITLETQNLPDAPNKPHFPSPYLFPGETYHEKTIYRFHY